MLNYKKISLHINKYLIIILTLVCLSSNAQNLSTWTDIDTLESFDNMVLVNYKIYHDSTLSEETQAFLYQTTIEVSRFPAIPNLFKREITADSIVFHGLRSIYWDNGYRKLEKYNEGNFISMTFFNQLGEEISEQEFNHNNHVNGPCGIVNGHYLIHGQKKKNN